MEDAVLPKKISARRKGHFEGTHNSEREIEANAVTTGNSINIFQRIMDHRIVIENK